MKGYSIVSMMLGFAMLLTQITGGEVSGGPLSPLARYWGYFVEPLGSTPMFYLLLVFSSILVAAAVFSSGFVGFYVAISGHLGAYTLFLGLAVDNPYYVVVGLLLGVSSILVAYIYDREESLEEHRFTYI